MIGVLMFVAHSFLGGNDMPNTTSGGRHIARSPGDHMQVEMKYRLPGCRSVIEANVEPVGTMPRLNT